MPSSSQLGEPGDTVSAIDDRLRQLELEAQ